MKNWKELFINQLGTLTFWKRLFMNNEHDLIKRKFLDASDACTIIKSAQIEILDQILDNIDDEKTIDLIADTIEDIKNSDFTGLCYGIIDNETETKKERN